MTGIKHTPGPFFTSCPHGGTIYIEARLRGSTLQEVAAVGPTEAPEQQRANANLFAASPALLAAAQNAVAAWARLIDSFPYVPGISDQAEYMEFKELLELRAAIAKATQ